MEIASAPAVKVRPKQETTLGLDYSSPHFYVDSNGQAPDIPHFFRTSEEKLAKEQRKLSRMKRGSGNYQRQRRKVAMLHEHIANQRRNFTHQLSREIANLWDAVCVEDLDLRNMARTLRLGKSTVITVLRCFVIFSGISWKKWESL